MDAADHIGDGQDLCPPLTWSEVPGPTRSFALIMDDPEAPPGVWVHWVLFDIPAQVHALPPGGPPAPDAGERRPPRHRLGGDLVQPYRLPRSLVATGSAPALPLHPERPRSKPRSAGRGQRARGA
ncbi:hypothetical protein KBZ33_07965 [Cyanobium sp. Cruz-8D1]|nr:hypothetical protein [Cyanobium sp. Cruz-8H5]MCP9866235.1 hypothetical protein [Cyanobium sp. Cruz-8D1]